MRKQQPSGLSRVAVAGRARRQVAGKAGARQHPLAADSPSLVKSVCTDERRRIRRSRRSRRASNTDFGCGSDVGGSNSDSAAAVAAEAKLPPCTSAGCSGLVTARRRRGAGGGSGQTCLLKTDGDALARGYIVVKARGPESAFHVQQVAPKDEGKMIGD